MNYNGLAEFHRVIFGCCKENRNCQNDLYRMYYPYGMSICIRYVENEREAVSILNDGFLKVFKNIKKFDLHKPFKPWFKTIVVNTAINHLKKNQKFKLEIDMEEAKNIASKDDILSQISYQELMLIVQSLSTGYRAVFNMYVIDGFKHQEIAEKLGITISTSKSNLTRARVKLQKLVNQKLGNPYV